MLRVFRTPILSLLRIVKGTSIIRTVLDAGAVHWTQSSLWAFSSFLGSFMPIWGAFFLLRLHRTPFRLVDFARHGEFGLYAAAFLSPSIYQILKSIRRDKFPLRAGSVLVAVLGILMAAFLYAGTNPQFGTSSTAQVGSIDEGWLMTVSVTLLALAFLFSFLVVLIESVVSEPDLGIADKVNIAFLNTALTVDGPRVASGIADLSPLSEDDIPSNDVLDSKFSVGRAEDIDG